MTKLRAGVIGAGVFGTFHARKYASLPGVTLTAVYDPEALRAERLAGELGAKSFTDLEPFLAAIEVVTIASPGQTHAAMASQALRAGRHAYVEKPLATTVAAAQALVIQAEATGLVLACGHQERVIFAAMGLMAAPQAPIRLESVRRGTPNDRNRDISCVLDLMIHDLDLGLTLGGGAGTATGQGAFDEVRAHVAFKNGLEGRFEASRIAAARERTMKIVYPSGRVEIDFLAPAFHATVDFPLNPDFAQTPAGKDPLGASVAAFLAAVRREPDARPPVTGEEGLSALKLALEVERAAGV